MYHCTYADAEAIDLLDEHKDEIFLSPAAGIMWANVYEGAEYGIDTAMAEKMGSVQALRASAGAVPAAHAAGCCRAGIRLPDGPIGRNAEDLELFVGCRLRPGRRGRDRPPVREAMRERSGFWATVPWPTFSGAANRLAATWPPRRRTRWPPRTAPGAELAGG